MHIHGFILGMDMDCKLEYNENKAGTKYTGMRSMLRSIRVDDELCWWT